MNSTLDKPVSAILDTPKVQGAIIFDLEGEVYFSQAPNDAVQDELSKLPQRILTMYEVIGMSFQECSDFILKYSEKNLYIRRSRGKSGKDFVLVVIAEAGVNFVSLKLVTNLAMKQIELSEEAKPAPEEPKKSLKSKLTYRGQKF